MFNFATHIIRYLLVGVLLWLTASHSFSQTKISDFKKANRKESGVLAGVQNGKNVKFPTEYFASADQLLELIERLKVLEFENKRLKIQLDSLKNNYIKLSPNSISTPLYKGIPNTFHDEFGNEFFSLKSAVKHD